MECRSAVNSTLAGKRALQSLPSVSPKSCFHHSPKKRKEGSYPTRISTFLPWVYRAWRAAAYCQAGLSAPGAARASMAWAAPSIRAAISTPAQAMGNRPTAVRTE